MLTKYLEAAMRRAAVRDAQGRRQLLWRDSGMSRGHGNARTLEKCRSELAEVLEDWLLFRIHQNLAIPKIDGLELTVTKEVVA